MFRWKTYELGYCVQCDDYIITCPTCENSSCNAGGCKKCKKDFKEFHKVSSLITINKKFLIKPDRKMEEFLDHVSPVKQKNKNKKEKE